MYSAVVNIECLALFVEMEGQINQTNDGYKLETQQVTFVSNS